MFIVEKRKLFFVISSLLSIASILALIFWGLNFGIEFTGGSLMELKFENRPAIQEIKDLIEDVNVQPTGDNSVILRMKDIDENTHQEILSLINALEPAQELRFESIGPVIGQELKKKSIYSIVVALIIIMIFIALAFRKVSFIVKSYKYGVLAIVALFHDILIVLGVFSILGRFFGIEIGVAFVAALLATLGYSVNDTIVVFDRVRENLLISENEEMDKLAGNSLKQTLVRSLNTSLTTLLVLFAIMLFGGSSIQFFVLALIVGIAAGTYSSLFLAIPLLVSWEKKRNV